MGIPGIDFRNNRPPALFENRDIRIPIGSQSPTINGVEVEIDEPATIKNSRSFIPLRFLAESLGCQVDYIHDYEGYQTIVVSGAQEKREDYIIVFIGVNEYYHNGERKQLDAPPFIQNGRTLIPVRAITEALGADVSWDNETRTAIVEK